MPTLVAIGNIRIRMFADDHNPPHFHVLTPDHEALLRIADFFGAAWFDGSPELRDRRAVGDGKQEATGT